MVDIFGIVDYDKFKEKIKAIIDAKEFKILIIDSAGNIVSDIPISALRDALKGANNKDFSTLEADVESILEQTDIKLSALRDALKPTRTLPVQELSSQSIPPGETAEFMVDATETDGFSALVVTVKATYDASATQGVRVRWLYSPNGSDFDSEDSAEAEGQYTDLTFTAGTTKTETVLIPIFQPYVKVQIVNLDSSYAVVVDAWKTLLR